MSQIIETLTSYVPSRVAHRIAADLTPITQPRTERSSADVLFVDISGFTPLTDHFARCGPAGVEDLSRLLHAYFGQLTALITAQGGGVIKFAGDVEFAFWPATDEVLSVIPLRVARCELAVQNRLGGYQAIVGVTLALKIAIGVGDVVAMEVSGISQHWEFLNARGSACASRYCGKGRSTGRRCPLH